jgi:hypothetical protein
MAAPPFNPNEAVPADNSLVSAFPAAERDFRDILESWMIFEHGRSGHHTFYVVSTATRDADTTWEVGSLVYNTTDQELQVCRSIGPIVWVSCISFNEPVQGTTSTAGVFEKATNAEVWAATSDKALTADLIEAANTVITLSDAATVAIDWETGFFFQVVISANRVLGNPTNAHQGQSIKVYVSGSDATDRTLTFGNQYTGSLPVLTDIDNGRAYLLYIDCINSTQFVVSSKRAT